MVIKKSKHLLIASMVAFAVLVSIGLAYSVFNNRNNNSEESTTTALYNGEVSVEDTPCSIITPGSIYYEASALFQTTDTSNDANNERGENIAKLEERILSSENYIQDANCLHMLTFININKGDVDEARKYLSVLEEGLLEVSPESYVLDEDQYYLSVDELRQDIETLSEIIQQNQNNNLNFSENITEEESNE